MKTAEEYRIFENMVPHFTHVVERICTPSWKLLRQEFDRHNFILVYAGEMTFESNYKKFKAVKGDMVYFRPGDLRSAHTNAKNLMKCFAVDFHYTCPVFSGNGWELHNPMLPFDNLERIQDAYLFSRLLDLFEDFTKIWISGKQNRMIRSRSVFMEMLSLLLMWKSGSEYSYDKIRKVEKVITYMTGHYTNQVTLEELSGVVQISPSYLGSIFREVTGQSPIDYLITIRMNKAKELIKDGYSISEVAEKVGFSDIFYFSKCFKKHEGLAPSRYKEANFSG